MTNHPVRILYVSNLGMGLSKCFCLRLMQMMKDLLNLYFIYSNINLGELLSRGIVTHQKRAKAIHDVYSLHVLRVKRRSGSAFVVMDTGWNYYLFHILCDIVRHYKSWSCRNIRNTPVRLGVVYWMELCQADCNC